MLSRQRQEVAEACRRLAADGLVAGTSGNVSARDGDHIAVTPTGGVLAQLTDDDVTVVDRSGAVVGGGLAPTSELGLHLGIYEHHEAAGAVVHTHAPMATALSCVLDEVPVVHYDMLLLGGPVRVAPYATFGSPELHAGALTALEGRTAALMSNHGTIAWGADVAGALRATELLEWACTVWWRANAVGTPRVLDEADMQAVIEAVAQRRYGATREAGE